MIAPMVGLYVVLAASGGMIPPVVEPVCDACSTCDVEQARVHEKIVELQSRSSLIARRKAARALGNYDWRLYPEAAEALAGALLHDPRPLVRQQAASSLARMRPCLPAVDLAVARAARDDSCLISRRAAKRALRAIDAAQDKESLVMLPGEREIILPGDMGSEMLAPLPTIRQEPLPPTTISPFAPGAEYEVTDPATAPPPSIRLEDSRPLAAPQPDFDRYDPSPAPYHGEIQPDDFFEIPTDLPPAASWPAESWIPPVATFPRPNYASTLLGIQP